MAVFPSHYLILSIESMHWLGLVRIQPTAYTYLHALKDTCAVGYAPKHRRSRDSGLFNYRIRGTEMDACTCSVMWEAPAFLDPIDPGTSVDSFDLWLKDMKITRSTDARYCVFLDVRTFFESWRDGCTAPCRIPPGAAIALWISRHLRSPVLLAGPFPSSSPHMGGTRAPSERRKEERVHVR